MRILLANPRGFCAGVVRAISIVKNAIKKWGTPIYVYHQVVHNSYVVKELHECGVIFVEQLSDVPEGAVLIFSAHGVSQELRMQAKKRGLFILDATCPLVTKVHMEVARASRRGIESILIGHTGHPEVEGTLGQYSNTTGGIYLIESSEDVYKLHVKNENNLHFMTQTTLSVGETTNIIQTLKKRFPKIIGPKKTDICYATTNRQNAVHELAQKSDLVLVVGSRNSSNSNRLVEVVLEINKQAYLIDSFKDINDKWIHPNINCIGITAGASAPEFLVTEVIEYFKSHFNIENVKELTGFKENIEFQLPKELQEINDTE
ncbi:MAG: 4-hydroxy-3-methylbut-2-enyl diphosphate reductase [Candidatus Dasytiphilus stammeri]